MQRRTFLKAAAGVGALAASRSAFAADAEIVLPSLEAAAQNLRRHAQTDVNTTHGAVSMPNRAQLLGQALVDCFLMDVLQLTRQSGATLFGLS